MSKKSSNQVIYGSNFALDFSILRRSVRARETKNIPIISAKEFKRVIIEFFPIMTLETFDILLKLSSNEGTKR